MTNEKLGTLLIGLVSVAVAISFFIFDAIPQDDNYHRFSDTSELLSVPNALNVLSNIPFIVVGFLGLAALHKKVDQTLNIIESNRSAYYILFLGVALVGVGSSYYHLWPNNDTLVWDRVPMTIAFMALFSIIIGEFVSVKAGRTLLVPLLLVGFGSVLYWWFTENNGVGDLRFYAVVQFFPILVIPILLIFFKSKYDGVWGYWALLSTYIVAKLFEECDHQVHEALGFVSGHTIKHLFPALGIYILIFVYRKRSTN